MRIRVNGWQRIGVVLSLLWVIFVCGLGGYEYIQGPSDMHYFIGTVKADATSAPAKNSDKPKGGKPRILSFEEFAGPPAIRTFMFGRFITALIVPLVFGWVIAYLCIFVVRWVAAGFKKK